MNKIPFFLCSKVKWGITVALFLGLFSSSPAQKNESSIRNLVEKHQQSGDSLLELGEFRQSIFQLEKVGNLAREGELWPELGFSQIGIAVNYWYSRDYKKLDSILPEINHTAETYLPPDHEIYSYLYNLSSQRYYFQGDLEKSLSIAQKDIAWEMRQEKIDSANLATSYNNIGVIYMKVRDFDQAREYLDQALLIRQNIDADLIEIAQVVNNLYLSYEYTENPAQAKRLAFQYLSLVKKSPNTTAREFAQAYMNLGQVYQEEGKTDSVFFYLKDGLTYSRKAEDYLIENIHDYLGVAFKQSGQLDSAKVYFQKSTKKYQEIYGEGYPELSALFIHLSNIEYEKKNHQKALEYVQKVFEQQIVNYQFGDEIGVLARERIKSANFVLRAIIQKNKILQADGNLNHQTLDLAREIFLSWETAIDLIDFMRESYSTEGAKQFVLKERLGVFEEGIKAGMSLYQLTGDNLYLTKAFEFAERSKSYLLKENLLASKTRDFVGIPDSLQKYERDLKREIAFYEQKLRESLQKQDSTTQELYQTYAFHKKRALDSLKIHILNRYPQYYQLMYHTELISLSTIQKELPQGTRILEYFAGKNNWYLFSITQNSIDVYSLPEAQSIDSLIFTLHQSTTDFQAVLNNGKQAFEIFIDHAYDLYQRMVAPALKEDQGEKLVIIPDGLLGIVPFEMMLTEPPANNQLDFAGLAYLIKDYRISYHFSSELWFKSLEKPQRRASKDCLAMAPMYNSETKINLDNGRLQTLRDNEASLPYSGEEIRNIGSYFEGDFYLSEQATKAEFFKQVGNYRIIHLATHSVPDQQFPLNARLTFHQSDSASPDEQFLYAYELNGLDLKAEMVVLSACETGVGKFFQGEGIASLGRGFMSAGAKSIIMSMWKIEDQAGTQLMGEFYRLLAEGEKKDAALRQAKLNYLKQADPFQAHPFFWAGYVCLGSSRALDSGWPIEWGIGIALMVLVLVLGGIGIWGRNRRITENSYSKK